MNKLEHNSYHVESSFEYPETEDPLDILSTSDRDPTSILRRAKRTSYQYAGRKLIEAAHSGLLSADRAQKLEAQLNILSQQELGIEIMPNACLIDDEKGLDYMLELLTEWQATNVNPPDNLLAYLPTVHSPRATKLRTQAVLENQWDAHGFYESLAGNDSEEAWQYRDSLIEVIDTEIRNNSIPGDHEHLAEFDSTLDRHIYSLYSSLAGLESNRSWKIRDRYIGLPIADPGIAASLVGLDSEAAWDTRTLITDDGHRCFSLAGLDNRRAWDIRNKVAKGYRERQEELPWDIAIGLAGCDSEEAWKMREEFMAAEQTTVVSYGYILQSVAGLNSERSWEFRNKYLDDWYVTEGFNQSLAGLDTPKAWEMRERIRQKPRNTNLVTLLDSIFGDHFTNPKILFTHNPEKLKLLLVE